MNDPDAHDGPCALARFGFESEGAVQPADAFSDSVQSEMPGFDAGMIVGVEARAVVRDREGNFVVMAFAGDAHMGGVAVGDGVADELADDAEDRVCRHVRQALARDVEPDVDGGVGRDGIDRLGDGVGEDLLVQHLFTQVPEASPQFGAARAQHPFGRLEMSSCRRGIGSLLDLGGGDLQGDTGQVLRKRVVDFDRETRAFARPQFGGRVGDLFLEECATAAFGEDFQRPVPDEDCCQDEEQDADDDEQPRRGPPGGTGEDPHVFGNARQDRERAEMKMSRCRPVEFDVGEAQSRDINDAADVDPGTGTGGQTGEVDFNRMPSVAEQEDVSSVRPHGASDDSALDSGEVPQEVAVERFESGFGGKQHVEGGEGQVRRRGRSFSHERDERCGEKGSARLDFDEAGRINQVATADVRKGALRTDFGDLPIGTGDEHSLPFDGGDDTANALPMGDDLAGPTGNFRR